ncbi:MULTISPECIES: molybdopterin synthase catalytic subunit MoaE [Moritella]|uniref:Molybdopterin synthase catalytic subunit n=1 Tax=Moritella viscosa TaxID=80854 RepID=A0ABY1HI86_9GAMM|nr:MULTISPECIES: molybdopterin synthase catalytic subunit MoaE [Moritella]KXO08296.1 Molybdenum cofactor biosynthesis protein MoaE [Moritella sp. JT01]SGY99732.1 Putative molybdenum cofactor biosynthesisprotein E [Moritella viscosa]SGZ06814.1 Putative molybdenum cofactor biosynthesisprotein E [Moritella viscosa]SGZ07019.1 Putative molybdenum cofactor biosynthesisprotein E [Moritella viscosa]SGZ14833.1 Putative molybdenum cofactor biosynthesisprotein E [Moritella viscosa]
MNTDMIQIQTEDFDLAAEYAALGKSHSTGAVVTFIGKVRDFNQGDSVSGLTLEHYPGMTEKSLAKILVEAETRWSIQGVKVIHRVGELALGDQIVFVGVASMHRGDAFQACEFIMDYLKTQAPFWKKEATEAGSHWVDARETDTTAADRWK